MDQKKKNRKRLAAAVGAAAVVFLVLAANERTLPAPATQPTSSETKLTSGGDSAGETSSSGEASSSGGATADRGKVVDAMNQLIDELGIEPEELNAGGRSDGRGDADGRDDDADDAENASITIEELASGGFSFGEPVTVSPGATVEVVNDTSAPHNVTSPQNEFKTPDIAAGETFEFTAPNEPDEYEFTCTIHPEMTGTLIVEEPAGAGEDGKGANGAGRGAGAEGGQEHKSGSAADGMTHGTGAGHGGGSGGASDAGAGAQTPTSAGGYGSDGY